MAAVVSVLGLAIMGGPLLARETAAEEPLVIPASGVLLTPGEDMPTDGGPTVLAEAPAGLAWFVAGGRNQGTENLALALAGIALEGNEPLYISDQQGRRWGSTKSDHYVGNTNAWAVDVAVRGIQRPTPQTEEAARRVAAALGRPGWTGGYLQVTIEGYRFQILWRVAGHFNHVHIGVKKV